MKKFLPYILIVIFVLVGLLGPVTKMFADDPVGTCTVKTTYANPATPPTTEQRTITQSACAALNNTTPNAYSTITTSWAPSSSGTGESGTSSGSGSGVTPEQKKAIDEYTCSPLTGEIMGCILQIVDFYFVSTFGFILWALGQFINVLVLLSMSSFVYSGPFVLAAWKVVRDLSNIFFIIILLYIAIKIILDLGGGEAKKMIVKVIIAAMLINFSMFLTGIVIDTSNILGLIFYNKIGVIIDGQGARDYNPVLKLKEKDMTGGLIGNFMPSRLWDKSVMESAQNMTLEGSAVRIEKGFIGAVVTISVLSMAVSLIIIGIVVFVLIALAFLNRIAMLLFLIIFSPFAFMSFAFPALGKLEYIGWDDWLKRLMKAAFFAPIFMFMMFFIFMMLKEGFIKTILDDNSQTTTSLIKTVISVYFGFNLIMLSLWFAIKYAYKASGKAGELLVKAGKAALVIGAAVATAGAGVAVTSAVGGAASKALSGAAGQKLRESAAAGNVGAKARLAFWEGAQKFDATEAIHGATGGKMRSGLVSRFTKDTDFDTSGGIKGIHKRTIERETERAEQGKVQESEPLKQALNKTEADLQELMVKNTQEIETVDKVVDKKRQEVNDANIRLNAAEKGTAEEANARKELAQANENLKWAKRRKDALMSGDDISVPDETKPGQFISYNYGTTARTSSGQTIKELEGIKKTQTREINIENATRNRSYAEALLKHGGKAQKEASHKIIMETKIESKK